MAQYSVQRRDRTLVENYGFLSFAKTMRRIIGKNIIKNVSCK